MSRPALVNLLYDLTTANSAQMRAAARSLLAVPQGRFGVNAIYLRPAMVLWVRNRLELLDSYQQRTTRMPKVRGLLGSALADPDRR
jgi:hypothetical protein